MKKQKNFIISCLSIIILLGSQYSNTQNLDQQETITIAILAKDKAHCLPLYLECIEKQSWPASQTYLYIRTNNNNDDTTEYLFNWITKVYSKYKGIFIDTSDVKEPIEQYKPHEWNCMRFKVLGKIRNESLVWAYQKGSHYFVVDCDNFILPHTLESLFQTNLPIVAPLLAHGYTLYSNYHADIDENGYMKDSPFYLPLREQQIKGLIEVPVVHCAYLIRHEYIPFLTYDDESYRYEYVIFSDSARKNNIPQYIDTRDIYGYITNADDSTTLISECWFIDFCAKIYNKNVIRSGL